MRSITTQSNLNALAAGFYTVRDAARLIEVGSTQRIYGWLRGYPQSSLGPLLQRDFVPIGKKEELSFHDLMEVRFVEFFRERGVRVANLRQALVNARLVFGQAKPFASKSVIFKVTKDKRSVLADEVLRPIAEESGDQVLWDLASRQIEFRDIMEGNLANGVVFDPRTTLATKWIPRPNSFPDISLQPSIAYGQPATPTHVPTQTIYEAWRAGDDALTIADWFRIPTEHAIMGIDFERSLTAEKLGVH